MKKILILLALFLAIFSLYSKSLSNIVVIIDPGHGGSDRGCFIKDYNNKIIFTEDGYNYDLALRLEKVLKDSGAIVFKTIESRERVINNTILPIKSINNAIFSIDGTKVHNGKGLYKRTDFCNLKNNKYKNKKVIFISIHFDFISPNFLGVRIIKSKNSASDSLSIYLQKEFKKNNLISNYFPSIIENGDRITYGRNLHVLGYKNKIKTKVLIELANTQNEVDFLRIRNLSDRDEYVVNIVNALIKYVKKTDYE